MGENNPVVFSRIEEREIPFDVKQTIICEDYPKKEYDAKNRFRYSKAMFRHQKNGVNSVHYLTQRYRLINEYTKLVIVAPYWDPNSVAIIRKLFPIISHIDVWTMNTKSYENLKSDVISIHMGFPRDDTYIYDQHPIILIVDVSHQYDYVFNDEDLYTQLKMVSYIRPISACLQFRPPFPKNSSSQYIEYFNGELQTICFNKPSSTELKLYVDMNESGDYYIRQYNLKDHESRVSYYNTEIRTIEDTTSFEIKYLTHILKQYINVTGYKGTVDQLWKLIRSQ